MAKALGEETLAVDENKIPSTATVRRVEERVEELGLIFEEREEAMFAIKEEVIHLLDVLDLDLNATSVEEMFIVNQEQFESLQPHGNRASDPRKSWAESRGEEARGKSFFCNERECIEIIYFQYYLAFEM